MKKGNGIFWVQLVVGAGVLLANYFWGMNEYHQYKKNRAEKATNV